MSSLTEAILKSPATTTTSTTANNINTHNGSNGNNNISNNSVDTSLETIAANALAQAAAQNPNNVNLSGIDQNQIIALLRTLPQLTKQLAETSGLKEAAAETLSNLSQISQAALQQQLQQQDAQSNQSQTTSDSTATRTGAPAVANYLAYTHNLPLNSDPGPNSHPHGPPSMGLPIPPGPPLPPGVSMTVARPNSEGLNNLAVRDVQNGQQVQEQNQMMASTGMEKSPETKGRGGRKPVNANGIIMGSDEWSRQRKDNHKEVERRRRGNINDGINELARIVPNGSGEKAKGAILSRACQYIHHLKENEARNIEKWTLEKLLMDQAMGDLQAQLEEVKRLWEEERRVRESLEVRVGELEGNPNATAGSLGRNGLIGGERDVTSMNVNEGSAGENTANSGELDGDRSNKRPRLE